MTTHSSTLAWKIPSTEEHGGLQSMGSQKVGHDWVTSLITYYHRDTLEKLSESRMYKTYGRAAHIAHYGELKSTPTKRDWGEWRTSFSEGRRSGNNERDRNDHLCDISRFQSFTMNVNNFISYSYAFEDSSSFIFRDMAKYCFWFFYTYKEFALLK